jgi:hydrogenase maturation protease
MISMDCHSAATLESLRRLVLVIGYGNPLRSDDGVGQQIAQAIADQQLLQVKAISVHQLTPELAEMLAMTDLAVFVDAYPATAEQRIQIRPLEMADSGMTSGHWCEPQALLTITQALYGHCPQAWWVMVAGENFEIGDRLSTTAKKGVAIAVEQIAHLINSSAQGEI